jgi:hypothetical protein
VPGLPEAAKDESLALLGRPRWRTGKSGVARIQERCTPFAKGSEIDRTTCSLMVKSSGALAQQYQFGG